MDCSVLRADVGDYLLRRMKAPTTGVGRRMALGVPVMIVALFFKGR